MTQVPRLGRPADLAPEIAEHFPRYTLPGGEPLQLFAALAHSPAAFGDLRRATAACLAHTTVSVRCREILILRTLALAGSEAEWAVHVELYATKAGLTAAELAALYTGDEEMFPVAEQPLVALAEALHDHGNLSDPLWDRLQAAYGDRGIVELLLIGAQYTKVALLNNALRLPVPPGLPGFPNASAG